MKVIFLGTGSGAGLPGLFCRCDICRKARDLGGKNIRSRSSLQIDRDVQIGFTPDAFHQVQANGHSFADVHYLLLTHNHYDHLTPEALRYRRPPYAYGMEPLVIFGTERVLDAIRKKVRDPAELGYELVPWKAGEGHQLDRMEVIPIEVEHDHRQPCYALAIIRDNRRLLYALDIGAVDDDFLKRLPGDMKFDMVVLDCALGLADHKDGSAHLNLDKAIDARRKLELTERLTRRASVYLAHITHHMTLMHQEIELEIRERNEDLLVTYDGLVVDLNKDD